MNKRRGKGYFYSMGARDEATQPLRYICPRKEQWPFWAQVAYMDGRCGINPKEPYTRIVFNGCTRVIERHYCQPG